MGEQRTHLAQLNIGRLLADMDDPRVAPFMDAIDMVNGIGKRSPGFVWMMENSGAPCTGYTETEFANDPRFISNLTVWEDVASLENFVWNTVHRQFYARRAEWFELLTDQHFVMWWVPVGHRPTLDEGLARLDHLNTNGPSDHAFGWRHLPEAQLWRDRSCSGVAAE